MRRLHYPQLGWNDAAQWTKHSTATQRRLDWTYYNTGGLDSLAGAVKWTPTPTPENPYSANGRDFLFVRDHLGSVALALEVYSDSGTLRLKPAESYEYSPYGMPSIHAPANAGAADVWAQPWRLAIKATGVFSTVGALHTDNILDPADIGRPTTPATNYGRTWVRNNAVAIAHSSLGWAHLFTARAWDADVRQYHYRYRWYDPHQCRWTALDPTGYAGGIEQYAYCAWNPVNFVDPLGLIIIAIDGTESDESMSPSGDNSHVYRFFTDVQQMPGESASYFAGPRDAANGFWAAKELNAITRDALWRIQQAKRANPKERVVIVGHSRGGAAALQIARELGHHGIRVDFLGLYDGVDMAPGFMDCEGVSKNVGFTGSISSHPDAGSRSSWNRIQPTADAPWRTYIESVSLMGNHSALGGDWRSGDELYLLDGDVTWYSRSFPNLTLSQNRQAARDADGWMRMWAAKYGGMSFARGREDVLPMEMWYRERKTWE